MKTSSVSGAPFQGSFTIGGAPVGKVLFERTEKKNVVRATITDQRLAPGSVVEYVQEAGVRWTVKIHEGKPINILASYAAEGANGFYVMVICSDTAIEKKDSPQFAPPP